MILFFNVLSFQYHLYDIAKRCEPYFAVNLGPTTVS